MGLISGVITDKLLSVKRMPLITKLLFNENHVVVELESGESLRVSYEAYSQYRLSSGLDLAGDLYAEIYNESRKFECMNRGLSYLGVRARSVDEMKKYLKKRNFSDRHIDDTVEYLKGKGYLDDYQFALMYIKERMKSGKRGKDLIVRDLFRKGISRREIDRAVKESGADVIDEEALFQLALKKFESLRDKDNPEIRVANYLRQRGFDYDAIRKILRRLGRDTDSE